jgi:hypothetical protein
VKLTISAEDRLVERARELARQQGSSLQELIRGYLRALVGVPDGAALADELLDLMERHGGHSQGRTPTRADAYEERL